MAAILDINQKRGLLIGRGVRYCFVLLLVCNALVVTLLFKWFIMKSDPSPSHGSQRIARISLASMSNFSEFWNNVDSLVGNDTLYPETFDVDVVLEALRTVKITHADLFIGDFMYSYKWILTLEGGRRALFKPQIVSTRNRFSDCLYMGCEHAEYEIAGFTLNRILGLRNMPYTTGRIFSWWEDILPVASKRLVKRFTSEGRSSVCSNHTCAGDYTSTQFCFKGGAIHGALIYWLEPSTDRFTQGDDKFYDYKPSSTRENVELDLDRLPGDDTYCKVFRSTEVYREDTWFADVTDFAVMDFLMSHVDSTHIYIRDDKIEPMNVMIDFGRAFCEYEKKLRIVAPITQCCKIRKRVYESLVRHRSDLLDVFVAMTKDDPLHPILGQDLQDLIGTRFQQLLYLVDYCVQETSLDRVLMDL